jgi:hypothetical protein
MAKELVLAGIEAYIPVEYREHCSLDDFLPSVVNLVTLSVNSPKQYLGCAHRHAPEQQHVISAEFSSPGFCRHSPDAGDWQAVINVHAVVSLELRYQLRIMAYQNEKENGNSIRTAQ